MLPAEKAGLHLHPLCWDTGQSNRQTRIFRKMSHSFIHSSFIPSQLPRLSRGNRTGPARVLPGALRPRPGSSPHAVHVRGDEVGRALKGEVSGRDIGLPDASADRWGGRRGT